MLWFLLARMYSKLFGLCHDKLGFNPRGIGFLLTQIKTDRAIEVGDRWLHFNHKVSTCYIRLIDGKWNEPETHLFVGEILKKISAPVTFVDVGANVGEMIVDVARYPNVTRCIGFEPNPECVSACNEAIKLNGYGNIRIVEKAVSSDIGRSVFFLNMNNAVRSSLMMTSDCSPVPVITTTLDAELSEYPETAIVLIDVEGAENLVIKGGKQFIASRLPLIIFEYNEDNRNFFLLEEISTLLGSKFKIFRLRHDGRLDMNLTSTWNCVAVHDESVFANACRALTLN